MADKGDMKKNVQRIVSYTVFYNNGAPKAVYHGTAAISSTVEIGETVDAHSLYNFIRKLAIDAMRDATQMPEHVATDEQFSLHITNHFHP